MRREPKLSLQNYCDDDAADDDKMEFVRCARFGANNQYWTFLLEVLSVIPEEVCNFV